MMFFRSLRYDLKNGCAVNFKKYLIVLCMTSAFCFDYYIRYHSFCIANSISAPSSLADYVFYIFAGKEEYKPTIGESFSFPSVWTLLFVFVMFMTLIYPFKDLNGFGKFVLMNTRSRKIWWYSKCCWIIVTMAIVNIIILSVITVFGLLTKASFSGEVSGCCIAVANNKFDYYMYKDFHIGLKLLLPFFVMTAMSMLQMTISLAVKPNVSFMLTVAHLISAAFYKTPFLFANYTMLLRSDTVAESGLSASQGILLTVLVTAVSMIIGSIVFSRRDILNKE